MASKKVYIDIVVDDKGTINRVAVDAKKLRNALDSAKTGVQGAGNGLGKLGENTSKTNKQTRALAGTAGSMGKTMGNLTSGITGGLVPAYATLAAHIFAITALFDALSNAASTTKLIAGQEALAANTGIAYKSITNSIKVATGAQISYKNAASAAAIGGAAGLSSDQLTRLGKAAKDTSLVLGRDLTDSFNRLIRGVTKAEPELLDELGIILRLEPATQKYAASIGKNVKELSAYERSQAVANEVLRQAKDNFEDAAAGADTAGESVQRLKASFDSIVEKIQTTLTRRLAPVFDFLAGNTKSLIATMGLLGFGILKVLTPAAPPFTAMATAAKDAENRLRGLSTGVGALGKKLSDSSSVLSGADFKKLDKSIGATKSTIVDMSGQLEDTVKKDLALVKHHHESNLAASAGGWTKYGKTVKAEMDGIMIQSGKVIGTFKIAARAGSLLLRAIPFIGIGIMLFDVVKMLGIGTKKLSEEEKKAEEATTAFAQASVDLNKELQSTNDKLKTNALSLTQAAIAMGNVVNSANLLSQMETFSTLEKGTKDYKNANEGLLATFDKLAANVPEFKDLKETFKKTGNTQGLRKEISTLTSELVGSTQALTRFKDAQQAVDAAISKVASSVSVSPLAGLVSTMDVAEKAWETGQGNIKRRGVETRKAVAKAETEQKAQTAGINARRLKAEAVVLKKHNKVMDWKKGSDAASGTQGMARGSEAAAKDAYNAANAKLKLINDEGTALEENVKFERDRAAQYEKDVIARNKAHAIFLLQKDVFEKSNTRLIASSKERVRLEEKISEEKTLGITIDQKLTNLQLKRDTNSQNLLKAEEVLEQATSVQNALKVEGLKTDKAARDTADAAVLAAESGVKQVRNNNTLSEKKNTLTRQQLEHQITLNSLKEKELGTTKAVNAARLELKAIEAGLTPGLYGDEANVAARQARGKLARENLTSAQDAQRAPEQILKSLLIAQRYGQAPAQKEIDNAQKAVNAAKDKTAQAQQQLDIANSIGIQLQKNLLAETQSLQFAVKMQGMHPAQEAYNQRILAYKAKGITFTESNLAFIEEEVLKQQELQSMLELKKGIQDSITSNFTQAFQSIVDGSTKAKDAFSQMAQSILADIAQMVTRLWVLNTLMPAMGAAMKTQAPTGKVPGLVPGQHTGVRTGGPKLKRYGGILEAYAGGGIARGRDAGYPAVLHGTEAVVPLPNGKQIPVEMVGGSGGTNNVSVNISMDNQGGSQEQNTSDNSQMKQLGLVISGAVQEELQRQKRPGGILSPYGAA